MEKRLKVLLFPIEEKADNKVILDLHLENLIESLKLANIDYTFSKNDDFDIVHLLNYDQYKRFNSLRLKGKQKNVSFVIEAFNDYNDFESVKIRKDKLSSSIELKFKTLQSYNRSSQILVTNSNEKTLIERNKLSVDIDILSPGIKDIKKNELSEYETRAFRSFYNLEPDSKVIVSLGDYSDYENVDIIINLARIMPDYEFFFFGLRNKSKNISKLKKAAKNVLNIHLECLTHEELFNSMVYNTDLLIVSSPLIIKSLNVLTFMKAKVPVISLENNTIYEKFDESKIALVYKDLKDLYDKVKHIGTTNCINEAYEYTSKFDMESYSSGLKKIYERVLNKERYKETNR